MVNKCCVPSCKSNYASENKGYVSVFYFPKNEERKRLWIESIPRKNFVPSNHSVVCLNHFEASDVIGFNKFLQPDGTIKVLPVRTPQLKENAVPKIFPDLQSSLSEETLEKGKLESDTKVRTETIFISTNEEIEPLSNSDIIIDSNIVNNSHKSSENKSKRRKLENNPQLKVERIFIRNNEEVDTFLKSDIINDFNHLVTDFTKEVSIAGYETKVHDDSIYFYVLNFENFLKIDLYVVINKNLQVKVIVKDVQLPSKDLRWVLPSNMTITKWSQLASLLSRFKNVNVEMNHNKKTVKKPRKKSKNCVKLKLGKNRKLDPLE